MTVSGSTGSTQPPSMLSLAPAVRNAAFLEMIFTEVNDHLRATDLKHLQTSLAYLGVVGIVVSILANQPGTLDGPPWLTATVTSVVFLIGISVLTLQRWYRVWKEHYIGILKAVVERAGWSDDPTLVPYWLRGHEPPALITPDNVLHYVSALLTGFIGLVMVNAIALVVDPVSEVASLIIFTAVYMTGLVLLHKVVSSDRYQPA
jgi:hypothetical protein